MIVLKEAEKTIDSYIKKIQKENKYEDTQKLKVKYKFLQVCNIVLVLTILVASFIVI